MILKEHNQKAYDNLKAMYGAGTKKVAIVQPTGTGKSYIAMKMIEDSPNKKIVIVAPTVAILNQYRKTLTSEGIDISNVTFMTYSKIISMNEDELSALELDNIVLDEFHHVGAPEWGKGVNRLLKNNDNAQVLGLSATPIRYLDKLRDMAEEVFHGNVASEMSLAEAILDGLLEVPEYHQALYAVREEEEKLRAKIEGLTDEEKKANLRKEFEKVKEIAAKIEGTKEILKRGITDDRKNGKFIVFCPDIKNMHKAMSMAKEWFESINDVEMYNVASKDEDGHEINRELNAQEMEQFRNSKSNKIKLMFAVNMLNEGIHLDDIDGIIMLRMTKSPIIFRQQLGRILSIGGKKNPLVFDFADNIYCTEYVFGLYQEMKDIIARRKEEGKDTSGAEEILKKFSVVDHVKSLRELVEELDDKTYQNSWQRNYELLVEYLSESEERKQAILERRRRHK